MTSVIVFLLLAAAAGDRLSQNQTGRTGGAPRRGVPAGDAQAGKAFWEKSNTFCSACHGAHGEGGYGPDLAGRRLSLQQFTRQVRRPWGAMPRWTPQQLSDAAIADVHAYLSSLPTVDRVGPWTVTAPRNAPLALRYFTESYGCAQCHTIDMDAALSGAAGEKMDFAWFAQRVYTHDTVFPTGAMGSFSRERLPESILRVMWNATARARQKAQAERQPPPSPAPSTGGTVR